MVDQLVKTVCNRDCPDVCGIVATVRDGRIIRLQGDKDHPITQGFLCHRTSHFLERHYAPDRLTTPLLRKHGTLTPVGWNEAMDVAAEKLLTIRRESGPAAVFHYRSGGSLGVLLAVTDYFFEQFGPVTSKRGDICSGAADAAQMMDFGEEDSNDIFDLLNAKNIILWGKNVFVSSPHSIPILKKARAQGTRLTLIDPVAHQTRSICDSYIQPRPGGDVALALAVGATLFERGWVHPQAHTWCDHLGELRSLCWSEDFSALCAQADVTAEQVHGIAEALHNGPTTIVVGWGMGRRVNGAGIVRLLDALGAITGNIGIPGGGVSFYFKRRGAFDMSFAKGESVAPRTIAEPMFGPQVLAAKDPPIRAVWITAGNPVAMLPESRTVAQALASREFVVVADSWMSDTARQADLVLPVNTLLEAHDVLGSYGHHYLGVARPVVPPPPGVKTDLEIMQLLAARVGLAEQLKGTSQQWLERIVATKLGPLGVTMETLQNGYVRNPLAPKVIFEGRKFPTPSGKVNLIHAPPPPPLPDEAKFPLVLMSLSSEKSQSSQWVRPTEGPAVATVHPDAVPGAVDGARAVLSSQQGEMDVVIQLDPHQRKDIVLMAKGGHLRDGRSANALIKARLTDLGEGAALYDERVRLNPVQTA